MRDTSLTLGSEPGDVQVPAGSRAEDMLFALELHLPGQSTLAMRFRTTPAALVATGLMTMLTLAGVALIRQRR